jgi:hypothetical protein
MKTISANDTFADKIRLPRNGIVETGTEAIVRSRYLVPNKTGTEHGLQHRVDHPFILSKNINESTNNIQPQGANIIEIHPSGPDRIVRTMNDKQEKPVNIPSRITIRNEDKLTITNADEPQHILVRDGGEDTEPQASRIPSSSLPMEPKMLRSTSAIKQSVSVNCLNTEKKQWSNQMFGTTDQVIHTY